MSDSHVDGSEFEELIEKLIRKTINKEIAWSTHQNYWTYTCGPLVVQSHSLGAFYIMQGGRNDHYNLPITMKLAELLKHQYPYQGPSEKDLLESLRNCLEN